MLTRSKKHKISRIITLIDFIIIILVIFYLKYYLFKYKTINYNGLQIKYTYEKFKKNLGFGFKLNIENKTDAKKIITIISNVKFFIRNKDTKKIFWEKEVKNPTFPVSFSNTKIFKINPQGLIGYIYDYYFQNEKPIPKGYWDFGVSITINTQKIILSLPKSTRKKTSFFDFF